MNRKTLTTFAAALVVGYWLASSPSSPIPVPSRPTDRPVLRWIARAAKSFLWIALVAEQPPTEQQPDHHVARSARIGDDGYPIVDHARGW
jgi:hypothetical protein